MAAKLFVLPELELRVMFHVKHHSAALPLLTLCWWLQADADRKLSGCTASAAIRKFTAPTAAPSIALQPAVCRRSCSVTATAHRRLFTGRRVLQAQRCTALILLR